jgi:hypothetical protein
MSERERGDRKLDEEYLIGILAAKYPVEAISEAPPPARQRLSACSLCSIVALRRLCLELWIIEADPPTPPHRVVGVIIARDTCQSSASVVHFRQAWPRDQATGHNGIATG